MKVNIGIPRVMSHTSPKEEHAMIFLQKNC